MVEILVECIKGLTEPEGCSGSHTLLDTQLNSIDPYLVSYPLHSIMGSIIRKHRIPQSYP